MISAINTNFILIRPRIMIIYLSLNLLVGNRGLFAYLDKKDQFENLLEKKKFLTNTSFYNSINVPQKHNHVVIIFKDLKIIYNDHRRFGFFKLIKCKDDLNKEFSHLGQEPFLKEFNLKYIMNYFKDKKKNIKNFLIDQSFVSGIGNIYANEILFLCKINPLIESKKLKKKQCEKIIYFSKLVLKKAIKKGGSSIKNFKNTSENNGLFQKTFKV